MKKKDFGRRENRQIFRLSTKIDLSACEISKGFSKRTSSVLSLKSLESNNNVKFTKLLKKLILFKHHQGERQKWAKNVYVMGQGIEISYNFR